MIATLGGRFGGYGLFLSRALIGSHEKLFRRLGLGLVFVGLLFAWLTKSSRIYRLGQAMLVFGVLWVIVVFCVSLLELGRGRPIFLYNMLDLERFKWSGQFAQPGQAHHRVRLHV